MNIYIKHLIPISLSTLLIACGSGGGKEGNHQQTLAHEHKESNKPAQVNTQKNDKKPVTTLDKIVQPSTPNKEQEEPIVPPVIQTGNKEIINPESPNKEQEKPLAQPVTPASHEKIIESVTPNKEQEKPIALPVVQASNEEIIKPVSPNKEQEKPLDPPVTPASHEKIIESVTPNKEQEKPIALPLVQASNEKIIKPSAQHKEQRKSADKPLDIPTEINQLADAWFSGGSSEYSKDGVRVYKLIENDRNYADDPNFKEKKLELIPLKQGINSTSDYTLTLLDDNVYYGFYRDSVDMFKVNNNYVYSFNEKAENKGDLNQLVATYRGQFVYSLRSNPHLATTSDVYLSYTKGQAKGKVYSRQVKPGEQGRELFDIKDNNGNLRLLELNPLVKDLDNSVYGDELVVRRNSPDRIIIETHFINGQDGTENKHLVGKGGNEKYWGVLGAKKVEK